MRHLLILLLALAAILGMAVPAPAAPVRHQAAAAHMGMAHPGRCSGDAAGCAHACLGCALAPAEPARVEPVMHRAASRPGMPRPVALRSTATGLDPPPPRRG